MLISKRYNKQIYALQTVDGSRYAAVHKGESHLVIHEGSYSYKHEIEIELVFNMLYTSLSVCNNNNLCYKYAEYDFRAHIVAPSGVRKNINRLELADIWADFNIVFSHIGGLR